MDWTTVAGALVIGALLGLIIAVFGRQKGPLELRLPKRERDRH